MGHQSNRPCLYFFFFAVVVVVVVDVFFNVL